MFTQTQHNMARIPAYTIVDTHSGMCVIEEAHL